MRLRLKSQSGHAAGAAKSPLRMWPPQTLLRLKPRQLLTLSLKNLRQKKSRSQSAGAVPKRLSLLWRLRSHLLPKRLLPKRLPLMSQQPQKSPSRSARAAQSQSLKRSPQNQKPRQLRLRPRRNQLSKRQLRQHLHPHLRQRPKQTILPSRNARDGGHSAAK
jgi:hypothetical protein